MVHKLSVRLHIYEVKYLFYITYFQFNVTYLVLSLSQNELWYFIRQSTFKYISIKRIAYLTDKLIKLANQSYCEVKKTSPIIEEVRYFTQELLSPSECRQVLLDHMVTLDHPLSDYDILRSIPGIAETTATSIIGELGDIRRFLSTNQINLKNTSLNEVIPMPE